LQPSAAATAANKSIPLEWLCDLARRPGVNLISLQQNNPDQQLSADFGIIDRMGEIGDLADTASLIQKLDLVISVDTVVAHVAAALGKRTWNMVRHAGYWPWLLPELEHSWYPSMRLYRQPMTGDWDFPIKQMVSDYLALVSERTKEAA
jgi:Glycosyltransferase family 9 (heptosyltransferase)